MLQHDTYDRDVWTWKGNFAKDMTSAVRLGLPLILGSSSKIVQSLIISVLLGRHDTVLLSAVSVSAVFSAWMDETISAGAVQTGVLCGQSFGAGSYGLVGIWLQMQLMFVTVLYPFLLVFKFATGRILLFVGVPAVIAQPAGRYAIWSSFAMLFELWYNAIYAYYIAQSIVTPDAVINAAFLFITSGLVWAAVYHFGAGLFGVAVAMSLKRFARCAALVGFCWAMSYHVKTWKGWNWRELFVRDRWAVLMGMTVPAMIGTLFEQAQWSINSIFAARLGPVSSSAFDLLVLLFLLLYQVVWGLSQGFGMLMAQELGKGRPNHAFGIVKVGACLAYGTVAAIAICMYVFLPYYAQLASTDPEVQEEITRVRGIGSLTMLMCGGVFLSGEILIKQGRVAMVFLSITLGNWFVGLPISGFLSPLWGIWALLFGSFVTFTVVHVWLVYNVLSTDWVALCKQARMNAEVGAKVPSIDSNVSK